MKVRPRRLLGVFIALFLWEWIRLNTIRAIALALLVDRTFPTVPALIRSNIRV
jgi:hypothetical protein